MAATHTANAGERAFLDNLKDLSQVRSNYQILHGNPPTRTAIPEVVLKCHSDTLLKAFTKRPSGKYLLDLTASRAQAAHYFLTYLYQFDYQSGGCWSRDDCDSYFTFLDLVILVNFGTNFKLPHLVTLTARKFKVCLEEQTDGVDDVGSYVGDVAHHAYHGAGGSKVFREPLVEGLIKLKSTAENKALVEKLLLENHQLAVDMAMAYNKEKEAARVKDEELHLGWGADDNGWTLKGPPPVSASSFTQSQYESRAWPKNPTSSTTKSGAAVWPSFDRNDERAPRKMDAGVSWGAATVSTEDEPYWS